MNDITAQAYREAAAQPCPYEFERLLLAAAEQREQLERVTAERGEAKAYAAQFIMPTADFENQVILALRADNAKMAAELEAALKKIDLREMADIRGANPLPWIEAQRDTAEARNTELQRKIATLTAENESSATMLARQWEIAREQGRGLEEARDLIQKWKAKADERFEQIATLTAERDELKQRLDELYETAYLEGPAKDGQ